MRTSPVVGAAAVRSIAHQGHRHMVARLPGRGTIVRCRPVLPKLLEHQHRRLAVYETEQLARY